MVNQMSLDLERRTLSPNRGRDLATLQTLPAMQWIARSWKTIDTTEDDQLGSVLSHPTTDLNELFAR
jgi:hypothetical protein